MARITWDDSTKFYEYGVDRAVLYFRPGISVPWNGIIRVEDNAEPVGMEPIFFDGQLVNIQRKPQTFKARITAYVYPDMLEDLIVANGDPELVDAERNQPVHMTYRVKTPNGHQIHLLYNCVFTPQTVTTNTIGSDIDIAPFVFDVTCLPVTYGVNIYPHSGNTYDSPNYALTPPPAGSDPSAWQDYLKNKYIEDQPPTLPPFIYPSPTDFDYPHFDNHPDLDFVFPSPHLIIDDSVFGDMDWLEDALYGSIDLNPNFPSMTEVFDIALGEGVYVDPDLGGATGETIFFGPTYNSYNMVQPNTGAEIHSVSMLPDYPDIIVTAYVEDPSSGFYGGEDDRAYHMVVAAKINSDLSMTFGTPFPSSRYTVSEGYYDDLADLAYMGKGVVVVGNRRDPNIRYLKIDPNTLSITELANVPSPNIHNVGDPNPGNAVKTMSDHRGNAFTATDAFDGTNYYCVWATTDGSSVSYTVTTDGADPTEAHVISWWFIWNCSHWAPVEGGVVGSGWPGASLFDIDWAAKTISRRYVTGTPDYWLSYDEEAAIAVPQTANLPTVYDAIWPTTTDTLRINTNIPISETGFTSNVSPINDRRIGQATQPPYAYYVDMIKLPDGSNMFMWLQNDGSTRMLTWVDSLGGLIQEWTLTDFNNFGGASFWYYDGISIDYVGNGRFVLVWTENAPGVEGEANEIYWKTGQIAVTPNVHPVQPQGTDAFAGPAISLSEAGDATTQNTDTTGFTLETGEHITDGDDNEVGGSVWWSFTPTHSGDYTITSEPTTWLTGYEDAGAPLNVYTGSAVDSLTVIGSDYGSSGTGWRGSLTLPLTSGTTYHIRVSTWLQDTLNPTSQWPVDAAVKVSWAGTGLYPGYTWSY